MLRLLALPMDAGIEKHPDMIVRAAEPYNAGPPPQLLGRHWLTPTELFFVRSHGPVPALDPASYRLIIRGGATGSLSLSLNDLHHFPRQTVTAALQCAGNRRRELLSLRDIPGEVPWDLEAIGQAEWGGVRLSRVLEAVGIGPRVAHVTFTGLDEVERGGRCFGFGGSIPLDKALSPEVLLAYEMNGAPLTPHHGAPLRLVVPGYIGARSVKWLGEIAVQEKPSDNYFQAVAYRHFPPSVDATTAVADEGRMLDELFVSAAICAPLDGAYLPAGLTTISGYAVGRGGRPAERIEVSVDGGRSWAEAALRGVRRQWTWQLWSVTLRLSPGPQAIIARATDSEGHTQPADVSETWNYKGYMNNAWHRIAVEVG
jgi:sulfite oxidase